jgi:hypothetical protein
MSAKRATSSTARLFGLHQEASVERSSPRALHHWQGHRERTAERVSECRRQRPEGWLNERGAAHPPPAHRRAGQARSADSLGVRSLGRSLRLAPDRPPAHEGAAKRDNPDSSTTGAWSGSSRSWGGAPPPSPGAPPRGCRPPPDSDSDEPAEGRPDRHLVLVPPATRHTPLCGPSTSNLRGGGSQSKLAVYVFGCASRERA